MSLWMLGNNERVTTGVTMKNQLKRLRDVACAANDLLYERSNLTGIILMKKNALKDIGDALDGLEIGDLDN